MCWLPYLVAFQNTPSKPGVPWLISIWPRNVWPSISWTSYSNAKCRPRDKNTYSSATGNTIEFGGVFFSIFTLCEISWMYFLDKSITPIENDNLIAHFSQTTPFRPRPTGPERSPSRKVIRKNIAEVSLPALCSPGKLRPSPRPSVAGKRSPNYSSRLSHR